MKTDILQQEILLITHTAFCQRQLCEKGATDNDNNLSAAEKLEEACWTGLLDELLPEIIANKNVCLWQIGDSEFSIQIELNEYPLRKKLFSINPYYFLRTITYN